MLSFRWVLIKGAYGLQTSSCQDSSDFPTWLGAISVWVRVWMGDLQCKVVWLVRRLKKHYVSAAHLPFQGMPDVVGSELIYSQDIVERMTSC